MVMENNNFEYIISMENIDLELNVLPIFAYRRREQMAPLWTSPVSGHAEFFKFEVLANEILDPDGDEWRANDSHQRCHLCDVDVPKMYWKEHLHSTKHVTNAAIADSALQRAAQQISMNVEATSGARASHSTYYCPSCSRAVSLSKRTTHNSSKEHTQAALYDYLIQSLFSLHKKKNRLKSICEEIVEKIREEDESNVAELKHDISFGTCGSKKVDDEPIIEMKTTHNIENTICKKINRYSKKLQEESNFVPLSDSQMFYDQKQEKQHEDQMPVSKDEEIEKINNAVEESIASYNRYIEIYDPGASFPPLIPIHRIIHRENDNMLANSIQIETLTTYKSGNVPSSTKQRKETFDESERKTAVSPLIPQTVPQECKTNMVAQAQTRVDMTEKLQDKNILKSYAGKIHKYFIKVADDIIEVDCVICNVKFPNDNLWIKYHATDTVHVENRKKLLQENFIEEIDDKNVFCSLCNTNLLVTCELEHISSKKHQKKLNILKEKYVKDDKDDKRKFENSYACGSSNFTETQDADLTHITKTKKKLYYLFKKTDDLKTLECKICHIGFPSDQATDHKEDIKHKNSYTQLLELNDMVRVKKYIICATCREVMKLGREFNHVNEYLHQYNKCVSEQLEKTELSELVQKLFSNYENHGIVKASPVMSSSILHTYKFI